MTGAIKVHCDPAPRRRHGALLALVLGAALLHLALLEGALRRWPSPAAPLPGAQPTLSVRTLAAQPLPAVVASAALDDATPAVPAAALPLRTSPPIRAGAAKPVRQPPTPVEPRPAAVPAPEAADPSPAQALVPVYPTLVAASALLRYRVRRDALDGTAELDWQASEDSYAAQLAITIDGRVVAQQSSQGGFDGAGLAPRRFTDRRQRAGMQAANFERERGEVLFSGPTHRVGLTAGAQDRLSWMLQIGAVLQAQPQRSTPGGELVLTVIGARGDARPWLFRFEAVEAVQTDAGPFEAVKWVREPAEPYDTRVEVWLAPSMQHLPVRLRSGSTAGAGRLDLTLAP